MVIDLEDPFKTIWRKGYLQTHPNGRQYVCLYNSNRDRTIISYARYLKSVELGEFIPEGYEVDHNDNDKTNDNISNLKVLSGFENKQKQHLAVRRFIQKETAQQCVICKCVFYNRRLRQTCGSKNCKGELFRINNLALNIKPPLTPNAMTEEKILRLQQLKSMGLNKTQIAHELKINDRTVSKYW